MYKYFVINGIMLLFVYPLMLIIEKTFGFISNVTLIDLGNDAWSIHDIEHATLRVAPDSTYKIYDALFGLEESVITPEDSFIAWNGENYPFEVWNADQTLQSAMTSSSLYPDLSTMLQNSIHSSN